MRIKFLVSMVGGKDRHPGDVDNVEKAEALRLIAAGYGEETDEPVRSGAPSTTHVVETTADPKAGVETAAGKRLFGAAAVAYLKRLAKA